MSIIICLKLWGKFYRGKRIIVLCDNQAVSQVINSGRSKLEFLQNALREICFLSAVNEFQVKAQFLKGSLNRKADMLSRWHLSRHYQESFMELTENFVLHEYLVNKEFF